MKKNNIKMAVEKVVNAAVKQKAAEPYSVMVSDGAGGGLLGAEL